MWLGSRWTTLVGGIPELGFLHLAMKAPGAKHAKTWGISAFYAFALRGASLFSRRELWLWRPAASPQRRAGPLRRGAGAAGVIDRRWAPRDRAPLWRSPSAASFRESEREREGGSGRASEGGSRRQDGRRRCLLSAASRGEGRERTRQKKTKQKHNENTTQRNPTPRHHRPRRDVQPRIALRFPPPPRMPQLAGFKHCCTLWGEWRAPLAAAGLGSPGCWGGSSLHKHLACPPCTEGFCGVLPTRLRGSLNFLQRSVI